MAFGRYARSPILSFGTRLGTASAHTAIRDAISNGSLSYRESVVREGDRLDTLAGQYYGNGAYWWVIAAASDIGWGLQVPPGTFIRIPDINQVAQIVG